MVFTAFGQPSNAIVAIQERMTNHGQIGNKPPLIKKIPDDPETIKREEIVVGSCRNKVNKLSIIYSGNK